MMRFKEKLKIAMEQLQINQVQVACLTGKSKASISQYLSGTQIPTEESQRDIAVSLGLEPDYFDTIHPVVKLAKSGYMIPQIRTADVGKLMGMSHVTVEKGLKDGRFPWGYAIKTSDNKHRYFINAKKFAEIEGIELPQEMVI